MRLAAMPPTKKNLILFADDHDRQVRICTALFVAWGFDIVTATTGVEACLRFKEHNSNIDLIVLDYQMPEMDGSSAACAIRAANPTVPIVLYTAALDLSEASLRRITEVVQKGDSPGQLKAVLMRLLN